MEMTPVLQEIYTCFLLVLTLGIAVIAPKLAIKISKWILKVL